MGKINIRTVWFYSLLTLPVISAIVALSHKGFIFKSGTAGLGAIILLSLYCKVLHRSKDTLRVIGAFLFSIAGDWFLSNKHGNPRMFTIGIVLFFFAHLGYLLFAMSNGKIRWSLTLSVLIVYLTFFFMELYPWISSTVLILAVLFYLVISCFSIGAAAGIQAEPLIKWAYIFGILLILSSDTIIALHEFCGYTNLNKLILPTYYLAHILITFALMRRRIVEISYK